MLALSEATAVEANTLLTWALDVHAARRCQRTCSRRWSRCRQSLRICRMRRRTRLRQHAQLQRSLIWLMWAGIRMEL